MCLHSLQVQKLSEDDGGAYHRALYARNVSSSNDLAGEEMPEPLRTEGDTIRFSRCTPPETLLLHPLTGTLPAASCCDAEPGFSPVSLSHMTIPKIQTYSHNNYASGMSCCFVVLPYRLLPPG